jgi:ssDNA-binding Zn-finger/Zn-ribbon topoisomerase 1
MTIENVKCPDCGSEMISRSGKYGIFWGCKSYPQRKGTRDSMGRSKADRDAERESDSSKGSVIEQDDLSYMEWPRNREDKISFNKK